MAPTEHQAKTARLLQIAGKKAPKARVLRYLKKTGPQLSESRKNTLLLKGIKANSALHELLANLKAIQAPASKLLSKKNQIAVFNDGQESLEFLLTKNDCSLFCIASHNKKRPNNIVMGRSFDRQILDMVEFGVTYFKSMKDYSSAPTKRLGSKPMLLFQGDSWDPHVQNLLIDFYRGDVVDNLVVNGLDHVIVFTIAEENGTKRIHQRTYHVKLKKSATNIPTPFLTPSGPDLDLVVRRTQWATPELYLESRKMPKTQKKKVKNQTTNMFGETLGRLHLEKQDVAFTGRKSKALRRAEKMTKQEEMEALETELEREKEILDKEEKQTMGY